MQRRLLKMQLILLLFLTAVNLYVYYFVAVEAPSNPQEYCDTATVSRENCIADLPGAFARSVILELSLIFFVCFPLLSIILQKVYKLFSAVSRRIL